MVSAKTIGLSASLLVIALLIANYVAENDATIDDTSSFSVSASGSIRGRPFALYYCTGSSCPNADLDGYPGFYAVVAHQDSGSTHLTEHSVSHMASFDSNGDLTCEDVDVDNSASGNAALVADFTAVMDAAGGSLPVSVTLGGNPVTISSMSSDNNPSDDDTSLFGYNFPSASDCAPAEDDGPAAVPTEEDLSKKGRDLVSGRKLAWGSTIGHKHLWNAAHKSYLGKPDADGWSTWSTCHTGNAYARFSYRDGCMVVGLSGTDGFKEFGDWMDNLNIATQTSYGRTTHQGFYNYMKKIESCMNSKVATLKGWGIPVSYIVGHSLGGAAATVYSLYNNEFAEHDLVTFGAPASRKSASCKNKGYRYAHIKDAVASNFLGIFSGFSHDIENSRKVLHVHYCGEDCWAGCCPWGWRKDNTYQTQSCGDKSGGCSWLADCAYYFSTVHGKYGDYL